MAAIMKSHRSIISVPLSYVSVITDDTILCHIDLDGCRIETKKEKPWQKMTNQGGRRDSDFIFYKSGKTSDPEVKERAWML